MKKIILFAAITLFAASCGQNTSKNTAPKETAPKETMTDEQFLALLMDIYYKLPESVMPDFLKTDAQRREVYVHTYHNRLSADESYGEGGYSEWYMAGYLTDDNAGVVLMVMCYSGMEGYNQMHFDKTLKYNIKTGECKEIERPMDPLTADELIDEKHFHDPELAAGAKRFYENNPLALCYQDFSKDGYEVNVDLTDFYSANVEDYYGHYDDSDPEAGLNRVKTSRKWNGKRFVKGDRWFTNDTRNWEKYQ